MTTTWTRRTAEKARRAIDILGGSYDVQDAVRTILTYDPSLRTRDVVRLVRAAERDHRRETEMEAADLARMSI